ncbi:MAG: DUF3488 and DUF4129 domain-containing transglutaminase family protein [Terriglobales bacterium]
MPGRPIPALNGSPLQATGSTAGAAGRLHGSIERYFEISLYLLITAGFTTLASTGKLDVVSVFFVFLALIVRGYFLISNRQVLISERWTNYCTLAYVALYPLDYFFLSGSFVTATVHLVLFAMVVKIFSVHRDRDYLYLGVLAFLEVLAACVLTVDTAFLAAFAVFALLAVATFIAMEIRRSSATAVQEARASAVAAHRLPAVLSTTSVVLVCAILVAAAGIFFVLPRLSAGYLSALTPHNEIASGFSNEVNLGKIGEIQQLNTVVMHIQIYGDTKGAYELKWRGTSLGIFDGTHWNNLPQELELASSALGRFDLAGVSRHWAARLGEAAPQHPAQPRAHYRVLMEPIGANVFFLAPQPESLSGKYHEITIDAGGTLYNNDRDRMIGVYEAVSSLWEPSPEQLRAAAGPMPSSVQLRYLQLPPQLDRRIPELAQQITASAPTNYDKAVAIETYLKARYGYTLLLPAAPPSDPVANFLFERKQGHCEYFASAMAVMLRTLGIPSRLITGFRGGQFNDVTGRYIIRARDAHSWVEVYFQHLGWVSFDPTPAAGQSAPAGLSRWMLYLDWAREFWREWIINYDFAHQRNLSSTALIKGRRNADFARLWVLRHYRALLKAAHRMQSDVQRAPLGWTVRIVAALAALLLVVNGRRMWNLLRRHQLARRPERAPQAAASIWYTRLTRRLARRGWRKLPSQTPEEFLNSISDGRLRPLLAEFTAHYERARFGDSKPDAARLPALFEKIAAM